MNIVVQNMVTGQSISIDDKHIKKVSIENENTLKILMNNDMEYLVGYHEELLKRAPKQLSLFDDSNNVNRGKENKKKGIKKAVDHANLKNDGSWSDTAYKGVTLFLKDKHKGYKFMIEDARVWTENYNLVPVPPSKRAWGGVVRNLLKNMILQKTGEYGTVKNENANMCYATIWQKI